MLSDLRPSYHSILISAADAGAPHASLAIISSVVPLLFTISSEAIENEAPLFNSLFPTEFGAKSLAVNVLF